MYTGQVSVAWLDERLSISYTLLRLPSNLTAFSFSVFLVCGVGSACYFVYLKRGLYVDCQAPRGTSQALPGVFFFGD